MFEVILKGLFVSVTILSELPDNQLGRHKFWGDALKLCIDDKILWRLLGESLKMTIEETENGMRNSVEMKLLVEKKFVVGDIL